MVDIVTFTWNWLERGYNLAAGNAKPIWSEIKSMFKMILDAFRSITKTFQAYVSYSQETSRKEENGSIVKSEIERSGARSGVSNEGFLRQGEGARRELIEESREIKELCERLMNFSGKVEKIMNEDEQHNNQQETDEKLRQLIEEKETQDLRKTLEKSPMVNPSLA